MVQAAFARARGTEPQPLDVSLTHDPPGELPERTAPLVRFTLGAGIDAVSELRLSYRQRGEGRWVRVVMDIDDSGGADARIPLLDGDEAYDVTYFAQALAPSGAVLARAGTPDEPFRLRVPERQRQVSVLPGPNPRPEPEEGGVATKWWFWTIIGVAVAASVTGAVVATSGDGGPPGGSLGNFTLQDP